MSVECIVPNVIWHAQQPLRFGPIGEEKGRLKRLSSQATVARLHAAFDGMARTADLLGTADDGRDGMALVLAAEASREPHTTSEGDPE